MTVRRLLELCAVALVACAIAVPASAQLTTGTISGTVKDPQGGVIPGASVVLTSETRGTQLPAAFTNTNGDFLVANVPPDTYSIVVTMEGFKTLKRSGIALSAGDRVNVGAMTIEVGGLSESVSVQAESPLVQTQSGERSFAITTDVVQNLPIANRSFTALASLAPGVVGTNRVGGGGGNNIMMDGVSAVDTGSNSILLQMNVESIQEVKVLVSGYQAEYGRSSGLQITAVTKSGTNHFRGSTYGVFRNSDWYSNSKTNILNGDPKTVLQEKDLGYSIGGPVGKPGGRNKLFFFYSHEFAPRTGGNDVTRYRFPTALERAGDFSESVDNNGALYPYIKDPLLTGTCSATSQAACFRDGGVLGRIPANRLYDLGLNILKMYPTPNVTGQNYNYQITRPNENLTANQPAIRIDYQPMSALRATFKYSGWSQHNQIINGSIPGFNDTKQYKPVVSTMAATANYTFNPTTFVEATYGHSQNELTGCGLAQGGTGPTFCQSGFAMNPAGNRFNVGLGTLPFIFADGNVIDPSYYAYKALSAVSPPNFVDGRVVVPPSFAWGSRVSNTNPNYAPPNTPFPGFLNINSTDDVSISVTKVWGRHTLKSGFYNTHSYKAQQRGGWNGTITFANDNNNPIDSTFGYANAALGIFSQYTQASKYVEGSYVYNNTEAYLQDNWKVNARLTFDYGVRFVHQQPQYDEKGQASNFLPDKWVQGQAPVLYLAGCAAQPCTGANRQALNPQTGALLGPNTSVAIGTLVPASGNTLNGLFLSGQGIAKTTYTWPTLVPAPRFGMAYDLTGEQKTVLRGGVGLFFDRPSGNSIYSQVQNPPTYSSVTLRNSTLQALSSTLAISGAPALNVFEYAGSLPSSTQWNAGMQMTLPWSSAIDIEYVGQHSYNSLEGVDINAIDFGTAFNPATIDPTLAASPTPGATSYAATNSDIVRAFRGYSSITQQWGRGWRTFHSLQLSYNRRFKDGLSFGLNDTISLFDHQSTAARLQHNPDGSFAIRSDQAEADDLLGTSIANRHNFKGNFVWDLPDIHATGSALKAIALVANDWQLSGVWTAATGTAYTVGFSYQSGGSSVNLTGSPNYPARIRVVGDPGSGCGSDPLKQFNTAAFQGPLTNSVGLESGGDYLRGCFSSIFDLAIARNIRLGGVRNIQLRVDMFNAPNSAIITGRNSTINLSSPGDPVTATNLPYDSSGNVIASRSLPRNAGFGVANAYQAPRTIQAQIRFSF